MINANSKGTGLVRCQQSELLIIVNRRDGLETHKSLLDCIITRNSLNSFALIVHKIFAPVPQVKYVEVISNHINFLFL